MRKKTQAVPKRRRTKRWNKVLLNLLIVISGALVLRVGFLYGYAQDAQNDAEQSTAVPISSTPLESPATRQETPAPSIERVPVRTEQKTKPSKAQTTINSVTKKTSVDQPQTSKLESAVQLKKQTPSRTGQTRVQAEIAKELENAAKKPLHETAEIKTLLDNYFGHRGKIKEFPPGWPVEEGYISSIFGKRASGRLHKGVDIVSARGTPIFAVAGGLVTRSESMGGYGRLVEIQHPGGYFTRYAHNSKNLVKAGDKVARGQRIALVGASGNATTHHVHFELRRGKEALNPVPYLFGKTPGLPKEVQMLSATEQTDGRH